MSALIGTAGTLETYVHDVSIGREGVRRRSRTKVDEQESWSDKILAAQSRRASGPEFDHVEREPKTTKA